MRAVWLLFLASIASTAIAATGAVTDSRAKQLRNIVLQDCGSCHGLTLKGGLGKPLRPENLRAIPERAIADLILDGVNGTPMPPWRGLLSDDDALWVARALKTGIVQ